MIGEIVIYCNNLEEVDRKLEILIRDRCSVVVEQAKNVWDNYDGRIRLTARPARLLARVSHSLTAEEQRKSKKEEQEEEAAGMILDLPRITYHDGCWWGEIVTRKTKRAAQRVYRRLADSLRPHRLVMSQSLCPNCGKREFTVWSKLLPMDVKAHGVPHFFS